MFIHPNEQVVSFELAKELKKIGIEIPSIFYWDYHTDNCYQIKYAPFHCPGIPHCYANTSAELMNFLPARIDMQKNYPLNNYILNVSKILVVSQEEKGNSTNLKATDAYSVNYFCNSTHLDGFEAVLIRPLFSHTVYDENMANALAKAILEIYKLELTLDQKSKAN